MSEFSSRHIGINNRQKKEILTFLGIEDIDELISQTIPENIRLKKSLKLDEAISENEFLEIYNYLKGKEYIIIDNLNIDENIKRNNIDGDQHPTKEYNEILSNEIVKIIND